MSFTGPAGKAKEVPILFAVYDGSDSDAMICPLVLITTALLPLAYRTCTCHRSYIRQEDLSWTKSITMLSLSSMLPYTRPTFPPPRPLSCEIGVYNMAFRSVQLYGRQLMVG